nr:hypothetical protein [Angustibacter aerolatus]
MQEMRERQQALKQPTGYDRRCLGLTRDERAEPARLHRDPRGADADPGGPAADVHRRHPRRGQRAPARRPGDPQGRRVPDVPPGRRRRRPPHGHHPRGAR